MKGSEKTMALEGSVEEDKTPAVKIEFEKKQRGYKSMVENSLDKRMKGEQV